MTLRKDKSNIIKPLIALFFIMSVLVPLLRMLFQIGNVDISKLIFSTQFVNALKNSITTSATATVISVTIAFILS